MEKDFSNTWEGASQPSYYTQKESFLVGRESKRSQQAFMGSQQANAHLLKDKDNDEEEELIVLLRVLFSQQSVQRFEYKLMESVCAHLMSPSPCFTLLLLHAALVNFSGLLLPTPTTSVRASSIFFFFSLLFQVQHSNSAH